MRPRISKIVMVFASIAACLVMPRVILLGLYYAGLDALSKYSVTCQSHTFYEEQAERAIWCHKAALDFCRATRMNNDTQLESLYKLVYACESVERYDLVEQYDLDILKEFERDPDKHRNSIPVLLNELIENCEHTGKAERAIHYRDKLRAWENKQLSF